MARRRARGQRWRRSASTDAWLAPREARIGSAWHGHGAHVEENVVTEIQMHGLSTFDAPGADMPAARATDGAMVSAMIRFGQRYGESLSLLGQEMLDFSRAQLSRDAAVALSLARCRDWSEASRIQQDWMRTAVGDYAAQMQRLFKLAVKATMDASRPLPERADAALGATGASV